MPRFHLHLTGLRWTAHDDDGAEFESLEHAYLEAFRSAREIWHELLLQREDPRACAFEITDGAGEPLMTVPLTEVLEACRGSPSEPPPAPTSGPAPNPPPRSQSEATAAYVATSALAVKHAARRCRLAKELQDQLIKTRASIASVRALIEESDRVRSIASRPLL